MAKLSKIKMKRGGLSRICELHPEVNPRTVSNYISGKFDPELWPINKRNLMMLIRKDAKRYAIN